MQQKKANKRLRQFRRQAEALGLAIILAGTAACSTKVNVRFADGVAPGSGAEQERMLELAGTLKMSREELVARQASPFIANYAPDCRARLEARGVDIPGPLDVPGNHVFVKRMSECMFEGAFEDVLDTRTREEARRTGFGAFNIDRIFECREEMGVFDGERPNELEKISVAMCFVMHENDENPAKKKTMSPAP